MCNSYMEPTECALDSTEMHLHNKEFRFKDIVSTYTQATLVKKHGGFSGPVLLRLQNKSLRPIDYGVSFCP